MKAVKVMIPLITLALALGACGGKPKTRVAIEEAKPGRDLELFRNGVEDIKTGHTESGRVMLNTMLNTYTDSPLVKAAKLAMADSFYLEGGSKAMAQAEVEYRDWLQFFPDDAMSDDVRLKIAESHMKQVQDPRRDTTHARQAEKELKELLKRHPESNKKADVEGRIREIQEYLAMHELVVARFYYNMRQAPQATQGRTEEILNKYPNFSHFDEALYYHAKSLADQEDTETASQDLTRLLKFYPKSEYRNKAEEMLKKWNKAIPEPDAARLAEPAPEKAGFIKNLVGAVTGPRIANLSNQGVIIDRSMKIEDIVARAQEASGSKNPGGLVAPGGAPTTNSPDSRPRTAGQPGQDVVVKPANSKDKDKDKKKPPSPIPPG
jgi:outer membrane protein assembly factor BamD